MTWTCLPLALVVNARSKSPSASLYFTPGLTFSKDLLLITNARLWNASASPYLHRTPRKHFSLTACWLQLPFATKHHKMSFPAASDNGARNLPPCAAR
jgi:hypothetical protein